MTSPGGQVVATAYVELRPKVAGSFEHDTQQSLVNPASRIGKHLGDEIEKGSHRGRNALGLLSRTFVSSSAGALGPLQEVADKFEVIEQASEHASSKIGARLLGIGAAATATGAFLETLYSRDQAAQNRLSAAIAATGHDISDYREEIEKAVDGSKRFGYQEAQTLDALNALTIGLHDPKKALEELGLAQDVAAAKNISLSQAANIVRQAYNGNTRVLKQFGIAVSDITHPVVDLAKAHKDAAKNADALTKAQGTYNDKLMLYRATANPTLAQQLSLFHAHQDVEKATSANARAQARLKKAQDEANHSVSAGQQVLEKIAAVTKGQAAAGADTFTGKLKAAGAEIESFGAKLGKDIGGPLIAFGPAIAGAGLLIESGFLPRLAGMGKAVLLRVAELTGLRTASTTTAATITRAAGEEAAATSGAALTIEGALARIVAATETTAAAFQASAGTIAGAAGEEALAIEASSVAGSAAMEAEGAVAVATASRIRVAFASAATGVGLLVVALANVKYDTTGLKNFADSPQARKALGLEPLPVTGANNSDDDKLAQQRDAHNTAIAAAAAKAGAATGKAAGDQTLAAFLKSINGGPVSTGSLGAALAASILAAKQKAVDAAQQVATAAIEKYHQVFQASRQLQLQVAQTVTQGSTLADAFSGADSGIPNRFGDRPVGGGSGVKGVEAFLHQRAVKIARFAKALTQLRKKGLDQRLISEIAQLGTDQGLDIAEQLLAGSSADIRLINSEEQQIARAANVVGKKIANAQYGDLIAADKRNADRLVAKLNELKAELAKLNRKPGTVKVTAHSTGATAAQIGAEAGRAVTLAMKGM